MPGCFWEHKFLIDHRSNQCHQSCLPLQSCQPSLFRNHAGTTRNWDWDPIRSIGIDANYKLYVRYDNICSPLRRDRNAHKKRERRIIPSGRRLWTVNNESAKVNTEKFIQTMLLVKISSQLHEDHLWDKTYDCAKDHLLAWVTEVPTFYNKK